MKGRFTISQLDQLVKEGKIRGYSIIGGEKKQPSPAGKIVARHFKKKHKQKDFIGKNLLIWSMENGYKLFEEYKFHPMRKWQFDWALVKGDSKIAVEYEGGLLNPRSGHRSVAGINRDVQKYNAAQQLGWMVLRLTTENYKEVIQELNNFQS